MPSLKYFDQATQTYKYVLGGMTQDAADARYLTSGFRNVIRNGDFSIYQRGIGPFTTSGYCLDGWNLTTTGGSCSHNRTAPSAGESSARATTVLSGQSAAGDRCVLTANIEGVSTLSGKVVTLSFVGYTTSGTLKIGIESSQVFGTGGSPTANQNTAFGAVTLTTTPTRYTMTFTMPSVLGMTLGTDGNDKINFSFWFSAGSNFAARASNIGIQSGTFKIAEVQLEEGSVATSFERLPIQQQLAWCQRYFQRYGDGSTYYNYGLGMAGSATSFAWHTRIPPMRAAPTIQTSTAGTFALSDVLNALIGVTGFGTHGSTPNSLDMTILATTMNTYRTYRLLSYVSQFSYIDASAEL